MVASCRPNQCLEIRLKVIQGLVIHRRALTRHVITIAQICLVMSNLKHNLNAVITYGANNYTASWYTPTQAENVPKWSDNSLHDRFIMGSAHVTVDSEN